MENEKNKLPYYIKIKKTKEGIPIIYLRQFRMSRLLYLIASLLFFGLLAYIVKLLNLQNLATQLILFFLGLSILAFPITLGLLSLLFHRFANTESIRLEPDAIILSIFPLRSVTMEKDHKIPVRNILAVICVPERSIKPSQKKAVVACLDTGVDWTLVDGLEDHTLANYLCDFIKAYYGLDEKSKNQ